MVLSSVMHPASVFVGCYCVSSDGFLHVLLIWRVPSWCLFDGIFLTGNRLMVDISFLTLNMELFCGVLIDWANQDFLLLLIILSMCWYYDIPLCFIHCVCNPMATVNTNECGKKWKLSHWPQIRFSSSCCLYCVGKLDCISRYAKEDLQYFFFLM